MNKLLNRLGVDEAISFTLIARVTQACGGILSIWFITHYMSEQEQGYYYTFASILAIQLFFELGLGGIITQFTAYQVVHLRYENGAFTGEEKYRSRLASLLRFAIKWYIFMALSAFVLISLIGFVFFYYFSFNQGDVDWKLPWLLFVFGSTLYLSITGLMAFYEGLGKVKQIAKLRSIMQLLYYVLLWGLMVTGAELYVMGITSIISAFVIGIWFVRKEQLIIINCLLKQKIVEKIHWKKDIFPLQWRMALSWVSGYFMFQLFNPVLFATEGAKVAGKMGLTLTVLNGITSLTSSWISTKIPRLSGLVATKKIGELDAVFSVAFLQGIGVSIFCIVVFIGCVLLGNYFDLDVVKRILSPELVVLMSVATLANISLYYFAVYMRCHNQEPIVVASTTTAVLIACSILIFGYTVGIMGVAISYCVIMVGIYLPWIYIIYKKFKLKWH